MMHNVNLLLLQYEYSTKIAIFCIILLTSPVKLTAKKNFLREFQAIKNNTIGNSNFLLTVFDSKTGLFLFKMVSRDTQTLYR